MRFPAVRERVRLQGRGGTFLVLSVDRAAAVADIVATAAGARVEKDVPLAMILPLVAGGKTGRDKPEGAGGDNQA
jgi:hypothetical protein